MTSSTPVAPRMDFPAQEVGLLVAMVRLSRMTLLIAEPGSYKSTVLQSSVVPLLRSEETASRSQITLLFDSWDKPPLPALRAAIQTAAGVDPAAMPGDDSLSLAAILSNLQDTLGATFLIIFDRFEDYLRAPADTMEAAAFEREFAEVVNDAKLRANFLLALDEEAEPLLMRLRHHIPRLAHSRVRLPCASQAAQVRYRGQESRRDFFRPEAEAPAASREQKAYTPEPLPLLAMHITPVTPTSDDASQRDPQSPADTGPSIVAAAAALRSYTLEKTAAAEPAENLSPPVELPQNVDSAVAQTSALCSETASTPPEQAPAVTAAAVSDTRAHSEATDSDRSAQPAAAQNEVQAVNATPGPMQQPVAPEPRVAPKRQPRSFVWAPLLVVAAAALIWWQNGFENPAEHAPSPAADRTASDASGAALETAPKESTAAPAVVPPPVAPRGAELASREESQAGTAVANPARTEGASQNAGPASSREAATALSAATSRHVVQSKPSPAASQPSVAPAPSTPSARTRETLPDKAAAVKPAPSLPVSAPLQQSRQPEAAATVVSSVPAPPPTTEAPTGPVLTIYVRTEAQRASAEQLIKPLKERGIRVADIKVVPSRAEEAGIRYHRAMDRNEAVKVAVALRDFGLSAQRLRQLEESDTAAPARRYEFWLPPAGD